jgi:hypothetical protein
VGWAVALGATGVGQLDDVAAWGLIRAFCVCGADFGSFCGLGRIDLCPGLGLQPRTKMVLTVGSGRSFLRRGASACEIKAAGLSIVYFHVECSCPRWGKAIPALVIGAPQKHMSAKNSIRACAAFGILGGGPKSLSCKEFASYAKRIESR